MLTFGRYLDCRGSEVAFLGNRAITLDATEVEAINKSVALWLNDKEPSSSCSVATYVNFTFNIPWTPVTCHVRMKIVEMNSDFMQWLSRFLQANNIKFPYASTFFSMLIHNCLKEESIAAISTLERIKRTRDSICSMVLDNENYMQPNCYDKLPSASSDSKNPLCDFEGEIHYEYGDVDLRNDSGAIVIEGLS